MEFWKAGFVEPLLTSLDGVPANSKYVAVQLRAWGNEGGRYPTWESGQYFAWRGASPTFNLVNLTGDFTTPACLTGLQSFSIPVLIPEPYTIPMAGLGSAALWLVWRRRLAD